MNIRQIERNEIDQIEALWNELKRYQEHRTIDFTQHYLDITYSQRKAELLAKDSVAIFLAELNGNSVGFCVVSITGTQGAVDSLFVQPNQRKCNIGKSLMNAGMAWLNNHDLGRIRLLVGQGNEEVLPFYEKLGFKARATMMEFV